MMDSDAFDEEEGWSEHPNEPPGFTTICQRCLGLDRVIREAGGIPPWDYECETCKAFRALLRLLGLDRPT